MLSKLLKPCLITSYDVRRRKGHFFRSQKALTEPSYEFKVKDVARSTAAAPTYFECARVKSKNGLVFPLIDE